MKALVAVAALAATSTAAIDLAPPPYAPRANAAGTLRIWGNPAMQALLERWIEGFGRARPAIRVEAHLTGSDVGMAALYTGTADIALNGRAASANEMKAFEWIYRYQPFALEIAAGGKKPGSSPPILACVSAANPLSSLTLAQLDAIVSEERARGAKAASTWGDLGARGEWAGKPITVYAFDTESGTGRFFRTTVLRDSRKLRWDRVREFTDSAIAGAGGHDAGRKILAALARDRHGLAITNECAAGSVKALPLAGDDASAPIAPTPENVTSRRYPLARPVYAYFNRKPGAKPDAAVAEFLRYIVSEEGQRAVGGEGSYLPLPPPAAAAEAAKLGS